VSSRGCTEEGGNYVFIWGNFGELSCEWGDLLPKDVREGEGFGRRANGKERGVWEEGKRQGAKYYLSRYPNYLRAPKPTIEWLVNCSRGYLVNCSLKEPSKLLTRGQWNCSMEPMELLNGA
jgi:hypothetical protein